MNYLLYALPLLGAFIGWGINKIVVRKLFRSLCQQQLAGKLAGFVKQEFSSLNIGEKISDPSNLKAAMPLIESHVDNFLRNKLKEQMPMITTFIGDKTINSLKTIFLAELEVLFPEVMKQFAANAKNELDLDKIVLARINNLSPGKLEKALARELRTVETGGAIAGFLTGLAELLIVLLVK